ncbi:uncharacterized protein LOC133711868 [Rosa rugosa]|uniref:uncharacterized protein LOC133711868 n=1 Tax=Rosa rugosa TaxID=74645 RepID=UPI002B416AC6|nr:uncharacterized protein LOC133711868 [Rosa rugosa]
MVPAKVQICEWRACQNILRTRERLLTKGYDGETNCLLCSATLEDTTHIFFKCPIAKEIFSAPPFNLQSMAMPNMIFKEWMLEAALVLKPETFEKLLMLIWSLWKNRNTTLWENNSKPASVLLCSSLAWLEDFQKSRATSSAPKKVEKNHWQPTNGSRVKINVDGAFLLSQMHGGAGGIARDPTGQFMAAIAHHLPHVNSTKQAELLAIRLEMAIQLQLSSVNIEADCLAAVQAIMHQQSDYSEFAAIIADIHDLQM